MADDAVTYEQASEALKLLPRILNGHKRLLVILLGLLVLVPFGLGWGANAIWGASQLSSDVDHLKEWKAEHQEFTNRTLPTLATKELVDARFASVEARLARMEDKLDRALEQQNRARK